MLTIDVQTQRLEKRYTLGQLAEAINAAYSEMEQSALQYARTCGEWLNKAKNQVVAEGENWLPWLQENCPRLSERSAQRYMRIADEWDVLEKNATVADLTLRQADELLKKLPEPKPQIEEWLSNPIEGTDSKALEAEIDRAQRRSTPITSGSKATVISGNHQGLEVEVVKVEGNGAIAYSKLPDGKPYPFLVGELEVTNPAPAVAPTNAAKPDLKAENQRLKVLLREVLQVAEMPDALRAQIQEMV